MTKLRRDLSSFFVLAALGLAGTAAGTVFLIIHGSARAGVDGSPDTVNLKVSFMLYGQIKYSENGIYANISSYVNSTTNETVITDTTFVPYDESKQNNDWAPFCGGCTNTEIVRLIVAIMQLLGALFCIVVLALVMAEKWGWALVMSIGTLFFGGGALAIFPTALPAALKADSDGGCSIFRTNNCPMAQQTFQIPDPFSREAIFKYKITEARWDFGIGWICLASAIGSFLVALVIITLAYRDAMRKRAQSRKDMKDDDDGLDDEQILMQQIQGETNAGGGAGGGPDRASSGYGLDAEAAGAGGMYSQRRDLLVSFLNLRKRNYIVSSTWADINHFAACPLEYVERRTQRDERLQKKLVALWEDLEKERNRQMNRHKRRK